ncbi:MAG: ABC transporter permease [Oligoflexus sp.]
MNFAKYYQIFLLSWRLNLQSWGALLGRLGFYALLLFVFAQLWQVALEAKIVQSFNSDQMIWYLAVTEWIILSLPLIHLDIEQDVRSGDIAFQLGQPIGYVPAKFSFAFASLLFRLIFMGIGGYILASVLTKSWSPSSLQIFSSVIPLGICASILALLFQIMIGLSAFWLQDTAPAAWVWQKLIFIMGGLILPLDLYPDWLQQIAQFLPFSAILYAPGIATISDNVTLSLLTFFRLFLWTCFAIILLRWMFQRAVQILDVNGG